MSSILLRKDHNGQKAGSVISVPFFVGKTLISSGVGVYPEVADKADAKAEAVSKVQPKLVERSQEPELKPEFPPQPQPQPGSHEKQKQR